MTARANVIVDEIQDALTVSNKCIHTENGQKYVLVYDKENNTSRKVPVKVLLTGEDRVAVQGDLQPGDELVVKTAKATGSTNRRMGPPI